MKAMHFGNAQVTTFTIEPTSDGCHKICLKDNMDARESITLTQDDLRDFIEDCHKTHLDNHGYAVVDTIVRKSLKVVRKNDMLFEVSITRDWCEGVITYLCRSQMVDFRYMLITAFIDKEEKDLANILDNVNKFKGMLRHD